MADLSLGYLRQVIKTKTMPTLALTPSLDPSRPQGHLSETVARGSVDTEPPSKHIE